MTNQSTTFDDHDPLANKILHVLEAFIDEIGRRECTAHFDSVVDDKYYLKGKNLTQTPERFIEDHLVFPMLRQAFGYTLRPQPKQYAPRWPRGGGIPDFAITLIPMETAMQHDIRFFGEVKPPKKIKNAESDMADYLDCDLDIHAVAILSDGFDWELWLRPKGKAIDDLDNPIHKASLRDPLGTIRTRNMQEESYRPYNVRKDIDTDAFSAFTADTVLELIETEFQVPGISS